MIMVITIKFIVTNIVIIYVFFFCFYVYTTNVTFNSCVLITNPEKKNNKSVKLIAKIIYRNSYNNVVANI